MSESRKISAWKEKAEIDYISLFIPLWLSLNAWMRDKFTGKRDRDLINLLKNGGHKLSDSFSALLNGSNAQAKTFQGNLASLHRALLNANVPYNKGKGVTCFISFTCVRRREDNSDVYIDITKTKYQRDKIQLTTDLWFTKDNNLIFEGFIEILYSLRCALFHGDLEPTVDIERVIKHLYLVLSEIMRGV